MHRVAAWRRLVGIVLATSVAVACEDYLTAPQPGEPAEPPVLARAVVAPESINVVEDAASVSLIVEGRSRTGLDSVRALLLSPSGNEQRRCVMDQPSAGDRVDGRWSCELDFAPGSETGRWRVDSVGLFSTNDPRGSQEWSAAELEAAAVVAALTVVGTPPVATTLTLTPDTLRLTSAPDSVPLTATVLSQYGTTMQGQSVAWRSLDSGVATVTVTGIVSPTGVGATTVIASLDSLADSAVVLVPQTPTQILVPMTAISLNGIGTSVQLEWAVVDQFGDSLSVAVRLSSLDSSIATVDTEGVLTAAGEGSTEILLQSAALETRIAVTVVVEQTTAANRWVNSQGGSFTNPGNWSQGVVPSAGDSAVIDLAGSYEVQVSAPVALRVLDIGGVGASPRLIVENGSLSVADSLRLREGSHLTLLSGEITGSALVQLEDTLEWLGGEIAGNGLLEVDSAGVVVMDGPDPKRLARSIQLGSRAHWRSGKLVLAGDTRIDIGATATLTVSASDSLVTAVDAPGSAAVHVNGSVEFTGSPGSTIIRTGLVNDGTVTIGAGRRIAVGGADRAVSGAGDWTIEAGGQLDADGPSTIVESVSFGSGSIVQGDGTLRINSGVTLLSGRTDIQRLEMAGTLLRVTGQDTSTVSVARLEAGQLQFSPAAVVAVRDSLDWLAGSIAGPGTLHLRAAVDAALAQAGSRLILSTATLQVDGRLRYLTEGLGIQLGGRLYVAPTGRLEVAAGRVISAELNINPSNVPRVIIDGELVRLQGGSAVRISPALSIRGQLSMGELRLEPAYTFDLAETAVIAGSGLLDMSFSDAASFAGTWRPGRLEGDQVISPSVGRITVIGSAVLAPSSRIELDVGGTASDSSDQVRTTLDLAIDGTLHIAGINGYIPSPGDSIEVLEFQSRTGNFSSVTGLDFGVAAGGVALDTVWQADRLLLVARQGGGGTEPGLSGVIAFTSDRDGSYDLYYKDLASGAIRQVTDSPEWTREAKFSPDRTRIAFMDVPTSVGRFLRTADAADAGNRVTATLSTFGESPTWSPDGTRVYFYDRSTTNTATHVFAAPANTLTDRVQVTQEAAGFVPRTPSLSPDGSLLAFADGNARLTTVRASDGADPRVWYEHTTGGFVQTIAWSPDGAFLAIAGYSEIDATNVGELRIVELATGAVTLLYSTPGDLLLSPVWSPDGAYLMFSRSINFDVDYQIWALRADGSGEPILVEDSAGYDAASDWVSSVPFPIP